MFKLIDVKALPKYKLRLRYADGVEGEVDLSDLAGKSVFRVWKEYSAFEDVHIGQRPSPDIQHNRHCAFFSRPET